MGRQYSPRDFLRQAPNRLLECYFHGRGLLREMQVASLAETEVDPIYEAWLALSPEVQAEVESDFQDIYTMACQNGIRAILEEGAYHSEDLVPVFEGMAGFHDKAFWTFLERRSIFNVALQFVISDRLSGRYWRKRKDLPHVPAAVDVASIAALQNALSDYFRQQEGRGHSCEVNCYRRGDRDYFFAFPEDYATTTMEWEKDTLQRRAHKPAFEVVFVYRQAEGTLNTYCEGQRRIVRDLELVFGDTILKRAIGMEAKDTSVYDLDVLKRRDFTFVPPPTSGIESVRIRKLRFSSYGGSKGKITLEIDAGDPPNAIYDLMEQVFAMTGSSSGASDKVPLSSVHVTQASIEVKFKAEGRRGRNTRTFDIVYPNSCSLKEDERDLVIRQMLVASKLEPVEQLTLGVA